jgi:hypothetical protein
VKEEKKDGRKEGHEGRGGRKEVWKESWFLLAKGRKR